MNKKEIRHYVVCNLSYAVTHALIETKLYSKVIANIVNGIRECNSNHESIERFVKNLNNIKYLGRFLNAAFFWAITPEKHDYWDNLAIKYHHYIIRF